MASVNEDAVDEETGGSGSEAAWTDITSVSFDVVFRHPVWLPIAYEARAFEERYLDSNFFWVDD